MFLVTLWLVAYAEELLWDRRSGTTASGCSVGASSIGGGALILAPLLAVPQLTHYVLDGFLWRRRSNPRLGQLLVKRWPP